MSAFGGKADMTVCGNPLSRSLLGVKRTLPIALHMSANDPKRTLVGQFAAVRSTAFHVLGCHSLREDAYEAARVHIASRRRGSHMAAGCASAAARKDTTHRLDYSWFTRRWRCGHFFLL